ILAQQRQTTSQHASGINPCQFLTSPGTVPVFCDTFDTPAGNGNRSGQLNGELWGVSHSGDFNFGQGTIASWRVPVVECGNTVQPENDVSICNGQLVETVNEWTSVLDGAYT